MRLEQLLIAGVCTLLLGMLAAPAAAQEPVIPIWPGVAPGSEHWTQREVEFRDAGGKKMVRNVVRPTLTVYLPERAKATGTGVVICPGGGFHFLSWENEGTAVAEWLRDHGVAAFVLKYRLLDTGATEEEFQKRLAPLFKSIQERSDGRHSTTPLPPDPERERVEAMAAEDGRQAMRVVRRHAAEWSVSPDRIGILGFSAGGMVTMRVVMQHDAESRPNFAAPIYGGSTGGAAVPADAPPLSIVVANDDGLTSAGGIRLCGEWNAAGKPVELHVYSKGGHGFGMARRGLPVDHWIDRFGDWLGTQGLLKPAAR